MWMILVFINVGCFALQAINAVYLHFPIRYLVLSPEGISRGFIWQFLTFQFLHADLLHLLINMIVGLWMFGRYVEGRLGSKAFLKLYLLSGVAGGLLQVLLGFLFPQHFGGGTIGASAGTFGLIAAFCAFEPYAEIRIFFILPVRARNLLYFELGLALFFTIVPSNSGVAHAAHLGGALFALAFIRWPALSSFSFPRIRFRRTPRRAYVKVMPSSSAPPRPKPVKAAEEDLPPEEFISQAVDPILDKISAHGIHSLTERERKILEAARKKMSKR